MEDCGVVNFDLQIGAKALDGAAPDLELGRWQVENRGLVLYIPFRLWSSSHLAQCILTCRGCNRNLRKRLTEVGDKLIARLL